MNYDCPLISIIVPVYNVHDYIKECVDSIIQQDYKHIEIILVDDGSTDESGIICDDYALKDYRVKVIHKMNGGLSDARNTGISIFTGEYITFIDSDDVVSKRYLTTLYNVAKLSDADIVQGRFTRKKEKLLVNNQKEGIVYSKDEAFKAFLKREKLYVSACCKLYKADVVRDIRFPKGYLNEDNFTTYKFIYNADKVAFIDEPIYWHRINENSIMQSKFTSQKLIVLNVPSEIREYLNADAGVYMKEIDYYEFRLNISVYNRMLMQSKKTEFIEEKEKVLLFIKKFPSENIFDTKFKIIRFLMLHLQYPYLLFIQNMFKTGKVS